MTNTEEKDSLICAAMKTFLANTTDIIFIKDINFIYYGASQAFADMAGIKSPRELLGKTDFEIFENPELARRYRDDDERMLASGQSLLEYIEPVPSLEGCSRYGATSKYIISDENGKQIGLMGVSRDITRDYEAKLNYERELRYLFELPPEALFAVLFDITAWRVVDFRTRDEHNQVISRYDTIETFLNNAAQTVVDDENTRHFFLSFSRETVHKIFESGKRRLSMKYRREIPDGTILWVHEEIYFLNDPISGHLSVFFILRDINSDKEKLEALLIAAERDSLTGLLNHNSVMKKISEEITHHKLGRYSALFMIDIDNFKIVNDTLGHKTGDQILAEISEILQNTFRDSDVLGRVGGDEFFAYMKNSKNCAMIIKKAANLISSLQKTYMQTGNTVELSCSVGISIIKNTVKTLEELYDEADKALYQAKGRGKNQFVIFKE